MGLFGKKNQTVKTTIIYQQALTGSQRDNQHHTDGTEGASRDDFWKVINYKYSR